MKNIVVLGSTGSIGTQTLQVAEKHPDRLQIVGLSANRQTNLLMQQIRQFRPAAVSVGTEEDAALLRSRMGDQAPTHIWSGIEGLVELSKLDDANTVVVATVGAIGVLPTLAALKAGKIVALANKEALVMGGDLVMKAAGLAGTRLLPIDSEHSAIFQCIGDHPGSEVARILLTGSGGPFRKWTHEEIRSATVTQALTHPNWTMGSKITIDSATLMNKGLEVIEAVHLFDMPVERVQVLIHPQSIVHSLVEFTDGSILAQLGLPDMRLPIQYALSHPERWTSDYPRLDLFRSSNLTFEEPDLERFPCLRLAYECAHLGGTAPAVLSVANEETVRAFLNEELSFPAIPGIIEAVLERFPIEEVTSVEQLIDLEKEVREKSKQEIEQIRS